MESLLIMMRKAQGILRLHMPPAILLSIKPEHAERILLGVKRYELRKMVPSEDFGRVYLYETGGRGIVGCFDVGQVIKKPVDQLWRLVGSAATTKERFFTYFANVNRGYAIEVRSPVRFSRPLSVKALNGHFANLRPPQSFLLLEPSDPLSAVLEEERTRTLLQNVPEVVLQRISESNRTRYAKLVTRHISANYADIDESFASKTLQIHDLGHDPAGFFTLSKEVLEIVDRRNRIIGFTTLTLKSGGCMKSGPTILLRPYRRRGNGLATRRAIEELARARNIRKLYCTCPQPAENVARYLLSAGMRIEAHLERHYSPSHNELVFGKLLVADDPSDISQPSLKYIRAKLIDPTTLRRKGLIKDFQSLFARTWYAVPEKFANEMIRQSVDVRASAHKDKPKRLVCLARAGKCVAAIALLPKRGGAVKGLLLTLTSDVESLRMLLSEAATVALQLGGRKLYFLHPTLDAHCVEILRRDGYLPEGVLRAPYRPGQDVFVLGKFL